MNKIKIIVSKVIVNAIRNLVKALFLVVLFIGFLIVHYVMIFGGSIILQIILFKKFDFFTSPDNILVTFLCPIIVAIPTTIIDLKILFKNKDE